MLDDIINKYHNIVHRAIKVKPIDVTSDSYAEYNEDFNEKDSKFKVDDHVTISKCKNAFGKGDLNGEPITGSFYEKEFQKTDHKKFRIEQIIKRKGDKIVCQMERIQ